MKTSKFFMALVVIFAVFDILFITGQNANTTKSAERIVEKINLEVSLSDIQKTTLLKAAILYFENRSIAAQKGGEQVLQAKKDAETAYKALLDSILTSEQKVLLKEKIAAKLKEAQSAKQ